MEDEVKPEYKKFRKFITSSGKLVFAGKNAEQNEEVVRLVEPEESVLHTKAPGSPFCVIKGEATAEDIKETAVFCAKFSKAWKKKHENLEVHIFKGENIFKQAGMKLGTFGVTKLKKVNAKKADIENFKIE